jgi:hypothetical protein
MRYTRLIRGVWLGITVCLALSAGRASGAGTVSALPDTPWDPQRYIGVDEIKRGMEGYCLTDYGEGGIEKFPVRVVNIIRDYEPGHNLLLVMGTDERFKHTGPVAGCSGSPVYIDGRLAGALARGWSFQRDPLYGVTPIAEMLQVGTLKGSPNGTPSDATGFTFDFSKPINLAEIDKQFMASRPLANRSGSGFTALPCPIQISGLPAEACERLAASFEGLGLLAVPGLAGTPEPAADAPLIPGCTLTVPLIAGDIRMDTIGTVTEVRGDRVYGFGHHFLGFGATNLPLAGGQIYTVVTHLLTSFKLGTAGDIIGAVTMDDSVGIFGRIGAKAKMLPMSVHVQPCSGAQARTYNCQVAYNHVLTPLLVRAAVAGAATPFGTDFPPDHTVQYSATVDLEDGRSIRFSNSSTELDMAEPVAEIAGSLVLLMNNPYGCPDLKSFEASICVTPRNIQSYLWSVNVTDATVEPGQDIDAQIVTESYLKEKRRYQVSLRVPEQVAPGKYNLMLLGAYEYEAFLRKTMPQRFVATNDRTLVEALNEALNIGRTKLYCLLILPPEGIAIDRAELPSLPETKSLVLQNNRRALPAQPYPQWIEKTIETGTIISDKEIIPITVEDRSHRLKAPVGG